MSTLIKEENIASLIYFIRGEKVMFDSDLATLYGVQTKVLKQSVKRNIDRFHDHDEKFQLIFESIRQLINPPNPPRKKIGFKIGRNTSLRLRLHQRF
jgi:hypothetical protein